MLIDLATAKLHVSTDDDGAGDALLTIYIGAAERFASEYLQRNIYDDQDALTAAIVAAPGVFAAAADAWTASAAITDAMDAGPIKDMTMLAANEVFVKAAAASRMTHQGIVINDHIKAAMLLIVGSLYANRENEIVGASVASLPMGSRYLLDLSRAY